MNILKKAGKILLYIIAGLLILLFVAGLFIDPIAKNLLEKQVSKAAEGQYTLVLDDLDVSILGGDVELYGVRFDTDSTHSAAPPIVFFTADEIVLDDVTWLTYLLDQRLIVDKVFLDNLDVSLYAKTIAQESGKQDTSSKQKPFRLKQLDIYPAIKQQIDRFHLKDLGLAEISLTLVNTSSQDTLRFNAGELNFQSDNILIDADKLITDSRAFYSTAINLKTTDVDIERSGNKRMAAEAGLVQFVTKENLLSFQTEDLKFIREPLQGNDTLLFAAFKNFEINKLDLQKVQEKNTAALEEINLHQLVVVNKMPSSAKNASTQDTAQSAQQRVNLAQFSLGKSLPDLIERVKLDTLSITSVSYRQEDSLLVENANFVAGNIFINEESAFADNRFLHAEGVESYVDLVSMTVGTPSTHLVLSDFRMQIENGTGRLGFEELKALPEETPKGEMWYKVETGPLAVVGINTRELLNRELTIDSIGINSPSVVVNMAESQETSPQKSGGTKQQSQGFTPPNLYPAIQPFLDRFHLRKLAVIAADVKIEKENQPEEYMFYVPKAYLQLRDVLIAEGTAFANNRVLHSEDIALRMEELSYPMPDSIYSMELGLFRLSTFEQFIEAKDFGLRFGDKGMQLTDSLEINIIYSVQNKNFRMDGVRFSRMVEEESIIIESIKAEGLEAYVHQNENYSGKSNPDPDEPPLMPQEMLKQLKVPVYLGSFSLESGRVIYEQLASGADTAGRMEVTDVFVMAKNVTNLPGILDKNAEVVLSAGGQLMGSGAFETEMIFNMRSDSNLVHLSGNVDTLNMTKLNRFTNPTTPLAFSSGQLYQLKWDIKADTEKAKGILLMSYEDLTIQLSSASSSDTTGVFKDIGSFLINNLALETDVPAEDPKEPEKAEISHERDNKGFMSYYIASLVDGLKDIVVTIF